MTSLFSFKLDMQFASWEIEMSNFAYPGWAYHGPGHMTWIPMVFMSYGLVWCQEMPSGMGKRVSLLSLIFAYLDDGTMRWRNGLLRGRMLLIISGGTWTAFDRLCSQRLFFFLPLSPSPSHCCFPSAPLSVPGFPKMDQIQWYVIIARHLATG